MSDTCRVIALDQPGFGFTAPRGERDLLPRERAEFVTQFLDGTDGRRCPGVLGGVPRQPPRLDRTLPWV
ncbi:hypothetical protein BRC61_07630 [Halobacteriales archaeon QH_10_65_19]|nr:MAG: hypothetical protein BRC61_07630 [Halobacteriales archaeon QH_10_65_19]